MELCGFGGHLCFKRRIRRSPWHECGYCADMAAQDIFVLSNSWFWPLRAADSFVAFLPFIPRVSVLRAFASDSVQLFEGVSRPWMVSALFTVFPSLVVFSWRIVSSS